MALKVVVFDFDGTIADTLPSLVSILNRLSGKYAYKSIKESELDNLRGKTSKEILKILGISLLKLPFVVRSARSELRMDAESIKAVSGIKAALLQLKKAGYKLGILSSNSEENINRFLKANNLLYFDFVYSGSTIFGKSGMLKKLVKSQCLKLDEIVYVGDETRDIEAAKKAGVRVIAVSWGFNSRQALENQKPEFLVDAPDELISLVEKL